MLKCLAKKPDGRYPTVTALGKGLAACAAAGEWDAEKAQEWWAETDAREARAGHAHRPRHPPGSETPNPPAQKFMTDGSPLAQPRAPRVAGFSAGRPLRSRPWLRRSTR